MQINTVTYTLTNIYRITNTTILCMRRNTRHLTGGTKLQFYLTSLTLSFTSVIQQDVVLVYD
jgi:hypothetical protein